MDGIGWAGAAMDGARVRLETAAGNLANASSDGFRGIRLHARLMPEGLRFSRARDASQGALRPTGRPLDFALSGAGSFSVRDPRGAHSSRGGSFVRDRFGRICDRGGRYVEGTHGALRFPPGAHLEAGGRVVFAGRTLDRIALANGTTIQTGFLESANVDAVSEMVDLLAAQRSFETAQKALTAIDSTRERAATQTAQVRE